MIMSDEGAVKPPIPLVVNALFDFATRDQFRNRGIKPFDLINHYHFHARPVEEKKELASVV
jgi:hypothetical protein